METETVQTKLENSSRSIALLLSTIVNFVIGIIELTLVLRFLLKMLGANSATPFVQWIYNIAQIFAFPFHGIFPSTTQGNFILEWSLLVAMIGYALLSYIVIWVINLITP